MKKILTFISGTALTAAAVIAVIALTAGGQASAQDAPNSEVPAVENEGPLTDEAIASLTGIADDLIDKLVADGVITQEQAAEARSALDDAETQLDATDWDMVEKQVELGVARLKSEIANADWDDIRKQLEDAIAQFDGGDFEEFDIEEFDFDPDSIDWSELENGFDMFKDEIQQFDLDEARQKLDEHLADVDWDDLSSKLSEGIAEFDFDSFKNQLDQFKNQFEGMDWDDLASQFEGQF